MNTCTGCGAELQSRTAEARGCCDVPETQSVEEQLSFWLEHDPEQVCVDCHNQACERRMSHA